MDWRRLGKQRVEGLQLLNANLGLSKGWANHPAAKMWVGHLNCLRDYVITICDEWVSRGYNDSIKEKVLKLHISDDGTAPYWLDNSIIHATHRAALLRKDFDYYKQFNWIEVPQIAYYWPV